MSVDPIDEHAQRLFASARRGRASERLVQRVLSDMANADEQRARASRRPSPRRMRSLRPLAAALLAAAACGVAAIAWSTLEPSRSAPPISAEAGPHGERGSRTAENASTISTPTPAAPAAAEVAPGSTEPGSMQRAETWPAPVEPNAPPRRPASRRTPHGMPSQTPATPLASTSAEAVPASPPATNSVHDLRDVTEAPPASASLSDELQALERARAALRGGDGRAALRLLDDSGKAAAFTRLAAEATLLRIEALYAVGELSESRRLAEAFTTENPDSHLGDRARSFIRQIDTHQNRSGKSPQ